MSPMGDETIAQWNRKTTKDRLAEIEAEFDKMMKKEYFAFTKDNRLITKFDPNEEEILFTPRVCGG